MAVAIHINYDTKAISHVTGVDNDVLCISNDSPSSVNDTDAVKTGVVFSDAGGSADQLKTFLTAMLAAMVSASDNTDYRYTAISQVGTAYAQGHAFYKSSEGTSHWTFKKIAGVANDQEPRIGDYQLEVSLDGDYDEASTDAKTFYDALMTKKNLL